MNTDDIYHRILNALERISPPAPPLPDFGLNHTFVWKDNPFRLEPVKNHSVLAPEYLLGIDTVKSLLIENTKQFSNGFSANNALLWGARGMGKSSLVKSVHSLFKDNNLKLVEIRREDLNSLDLLISIIEKLHVRFIVFCDDLSFGTDDAAYKSLKALLDGGVKNKPRNIVFYATSNRRHLMPRDMIENEKSTAINPEEAVEEKISLSDRFGLWLGFYKCTQEDYFSMVKQYQQMAKIEIKEKLLLSEALAWQQMRGSRSGRVAWQFITDLAGRNGVDLANKF